MNADIWSPLRAELDHWRDRGRIARLWLRDDDAVEPTPELARLLDIAHRHQAPATLAVIPRDSGEALARYLNSSPMMSVVVHGWSHDNHAGSGEKKQELGAYRPQEQVLAELQAGLEKLQRLHGAQFAAMLVPPWNRIAPVVVEALPQLGFQALSVFGAEKSAPLPLINTHVDVMDWRGTRGGRDADILVAEVIARLREMHDGQVMGFLTHHLVHDERAWAFIDALLDVTSAHPACQWAHLPDLLA